MSEHIGERIRKLRELAGLTQNELAKRAKVQQSMLSHLEDGSQQDIKMSAAVRIADVLQVPLDLLAGRKS